MSDLFNEFIGKEVKVPYLDGGTLKVARGRLEGHDDTFVKIKGDLGVIIILKTNIQKLSKVI